MASSGTSIAVFHRNLRVVDNPVLDGAAAAERVVPLFVRDRQIVDGFSNPRRQHFLNASLADLDSSLRGLGAALIYRHGEPVEEIARLAHQVDAEAVHVAADVSSYAQDRQARPHRVLAEQRRRLVVHDAVVTVQPPGAIVPTGSDHFRVFTPYFRRWIDTPRRPILTRPDRLRLPDGLRTGRIPRGRTVDGWSGGETEGRRRVEAWFARGLNRYHEQHDDLAADETSQLSPYLHMGCVSPVELAARVARRCDDGAEAFLRQLAWRDFHHQVLAARPDVAWRDYRSRGDRWTVDSEDWFAWRDGETGYPIVDAGMRQLASIGWMHNRARLIVAGFLTKTLYVDWRLGARHFLDHLLDGDLANNNLNWQWVAGTGTDTRPNRVLNPIRQALRFDPDGSYVRRWVPELAVLTRPAELHQPWRLPAAERRRLAYPDPVIELAEGRDRFRQGRPMAK